MYRVVTMVTPRRSEKHELEDISEVVALFDDERQYIIVRYDTDEEWVTLGHVMSQLNERAVQAAALATVVNPTVRLWKPAVHVADGAGWRSFWQPEVMAVQVMAQGAGPRRPGRPG